MSQIGLDQYLFCVPKGTTDPQMDYPPVPTTAEGWATWGARNQLVYWRKANQVHAFFVDYCANEVDNCEPMKVHPEVLADLYRRCREVLDDHGMAKMLLPTRSGFFFGSTDYDEWYFRDLEDTCKELTENVLNNADVRGRDLYYLASW